MERISNLEQLAEGEFVTSVCIKANVVTCENYVVSKVTKDQAWLLHGNKEKFILRSSCIGGTTWWFRGCFNEETFIRDRIDDLHQRLGVWKARLKETTEKKTFIVRMDREYPQGSILVLPKGQKAKVEESEGDCTGCIFDGLLYAEQDLKYGATCDYITCSRRTDNKNIIIKGIQ